ncbi:MAG: cation-translocating P-type ATPase [Lachnoclostridium sp.]|nr:cation-translocating P-type ATPase [Lachnoclostridium sp.]
MSNDNQSMIGLTKEQVKAQLSRYGINELTPQKKESFIKKILSIISEPMFILLIGAAIIYFILGEARDGAVMLVFVMGIIGVDVIQEWKTGRTLAALKDLTEPHVTVIRDGKEEQTASSEIVPDDIMLIHEGIKIPADGVILRCNDLCVDESTLTGEAEAVWKIPANEEKETRKEKSLSEKEWSKDILHKEYWRKDYCYAGTMVLQGTAVLQVEKTGMATEYGKIGLGVSMAESEKTPLQKQTGSLVRLSAGIAAALFVLVGVITWLSLSGKDFSERIIKSILSGITLAMAMIPEEFPVVLTVFLSMGAWRLAKKRSLVRNLPSVETLGTVSVLCVDKTGTLTQNHMTVQEIRPVGCDKEQLVETMGLACETDAYDPMEKAMLAYCEEKNVAKAHLFGGELISEYAFTNELKMMGHVWQHDGEIVIAAKGSPEQILTICRMDKEEQKKVENEILMMSKEGLRVIAAAIGKMQRKADIPDKITECSLVFCGLIGLADPIRDSIKKDISICNKAGIRVVMITGDNGVTAASIAKQIGLPDCEHIITGDMLESMTEEELKKHVKGSSIFSRVIPEHKRKIVNALKANGEVVAMTGDGVNDAPALKNADIGIAMGQSGSEVSREAADLILMDDNFSTIVDTIQDGRRIYDNIRKAVGYIFTIHIPIALASLLAPSLGISSAELMFLPLHIVILELIIDPTCSIVLERQPAEQNIMERPPRKPKEKLLTDGMIWKSLIQGLFVFAAAFGIYLFILALGLGSAETARSMGLAVLMVANLFLVQVNSSDRDSIFYSVRKLVRDKMMWLSVFLTAFVLVLILYSPLNQFLSLAPLSGEQMIVVCVLAAVSVLWYEAVKFVKRAAK